MNGIGNFLQILAGMDKVYYLLAVGFTSREVFRSMLELSKRLFAEGKSCDEVLDMLMPA